MANQIFFSSDLHFMHDREFLYKPRGFNSIYEMNEAIVKNFNEVIDDDDDLYLLGDLMLNDNDAGMKLFNQLPGRKHLIIGNHDIDSRVELYKNGRQVVEILGYATMFRYKKFHFYLSHYPTMTSNLDDNGKLYKSVINLYGHTHQKTNFYNDIPFMYHVGLDSHNCYPVDIDTIIGDIIIKRDECLKML